MQLFKFINIFLTIDLMTSFIHYASKAYYGLLLTSVLRKTESGSIVGFGLLHCFLITYCNLRKRNLIKFNCYASTPVNRLESISYKKGQLVFEDFFLTEEYIFLFKFQSFHP